MNSSELNTFWERVQKRAVPVAAVATALALIGAFLNGKAFFQAYLMGYLFWLGLSLGCLVWLMIHHLTGGSWGFITRRYMEAGTRILPVMAILFIPIVIGMPHLFEWTDGERVAGDYVLKAKSLYLNVPFFIGRAVMYFVIWIGLALLLNRWSRRQDETGEARLNQSMRVASGIGVVLYGLAATFASFDWLMSIDPHWFSSIYGPLFMVGHGLTAIAFLAVALIATSKYKPISDQVKQDHYHDLGKLIFACVVLWAYMTFAQFLIIWSGNLPEQIAWYIMRSGTEWKVVAALMTIFHFAIPFIVLLSRLTKQRGPILIKVAFAILLVRFVDLFWLIAPGVNHGHFHVHWLDGVLPIALGGVWLALFARQARAMSVLPLSDPRFDHGAEVSEAI